MNRIDRMKAEIEAEPDALKRLNMALGGIADAMGPDYTPDPWERQLLDSAILNLILVHQDRGHGVGEEAEWHYSSEGLGDWTLKLTQTAQGIDARSGETA